MSDKDQPLVRRGFYFFFSHNEQPSVYERYSFEAKITVHDTGEVLTLDSSTDEFWYRPVSSEALSSGNALYKLSGTLSSYELPAMVAFVGNVRPGANASATVSAFDSYQRQYHAAAFAIRPSQIMHFWQNEPMTTLPRLSANPFIFVEPITEQVLTFRPTAFAAKLRIIVEEPTGFKPNIMVNGQSAGTPHLVPASGTGPEMFRWWVICLTQVHPSRSPLVQVSCRTPYGRRLATANFEYTELPGPWLWGYGLKGLSPIHYNGSEGGSTSITPSVGLYGLVEELPLVTEQPSPPTVDEPGSMTISVSGRTTAMLAQPAVAEQYHMVDVQDTPGSYRSLYVWNQFWGSSLFALVDASRPLSREAESRGLLAAVEGAWALVKLDSSASNCLGLSTAARADQVSVEQPSSPEARWI